MAYCTDEENRLSPSERWLHVTPVALASRRHPHRGAVGPGGFERDLRAAQEMDLPP